MGIKVHKPAVYLTLLLCIVLPIGADTIHVLNSGDTLYSLSRQYSVPVDELLAVNNISDPSTLSVGMRLTIPGIDKNAAVSTEVDEYKVKKGDTYYSIARAHAMVVDELLSLNSRRSDRVLSVGENLFVKASDSVKSSEPDPSLQTLSFTAAEPVKVTQVPQWPVAGMKVPLNGKLVGVSIAADPRSYVHAVADGSVVWTGPYRGFGHVVLVDSHGYIYLYGGNEDLFVNVGQSVETGSRIGRLGPSGSNGDTREMIFSVFREGIPVSPDDAPRG